MSRLTVHFLPQSKPVDLSGAIAVVIDVLRATTTIVTALAHGAHAVVPLADVSTARELARDMASSDAILGGERGGARIEGFDLDNSPCNYTRETVAGKHIIFTTSHGTRAIAWSESASRVLIASFSNLAAVVRELRKASEDIHLVCSGTDGYASIEDSMCACELAGQIWQSQGQPSWQDDAALILLELYRMGTASGEGERLRLMTLGRGGQRLTSLGMQRDIAYAAQLDRFDIVPWLDRSCEPGRIVAKNAPGSE